MMDPCEERPAVRCLVSYPLSENVLNITAPIVVGLELAVELHKKGYMVIGPDPHDELALAEWERARRWMQQFREDDGA